MMKFLRWLVGSLFAFLLGWLGIERYRNRKKDQQIEEQQKQIIHQQKQNQVYETFIVETQKVVEANEEIHEEQKVEEQQIQETETDEEVIAFANDIVSRFNAERMRNN
ncbi:MAG: hypothetical protein WDA14_12140 [Sphaerochaetaceae bacterium]